MTETETECRYSWLLAERVYRVLKVSKTLNVALAYSLAHTRPSFRRSFIRRVRNRTQLGRQRSKLSRSLLSNSR